MIDFRYHLVSLVSVFLALAVGIVLGAGPLAEPISGSLTGQVDKLREDRNALQSELDVARLDVNNRNKFIEAVGTSLTAKALDGRKIVILALPGADGDDIESTTQALSNAGGAVVGQINLTSLWSDADKSKYRDALAGQIPQYLSSQPAASASTTQVLTLALAQIITKGADETLETILTSSDGALIEAEKALSGAADGAVIVGPPPVAKSAESGAAEEKAEASDKTFVEVAQALSHALPGAAVVGPATSSQDLVSVLRADKAGVTTVDSVGTTISSVVLPLALANAYAGTTGDWGVAEDASAVLPPAVSATPTPAPDQTATAQTGDQAAADQAAQQAAQQAADQAAQPQS